MFITVEGKICNSTTYIHCIILVISIFLYRKYIVYLNKRVKSGLIYDECVPNITFNNLYIDVYVKLNSKTIN